MTKQDISACEAIERACFSSPWSFAELSKLCENPLACYYTAAEDGEVVGYGGMYCVLDEGSINNIGVLPQYRRRGAAGALLDALIDSGCKLGLSRLTLEVRESNTAAISLYRSRGFSEVGLRKKFYSNPREDGIIMEKIL